jgi:hypothetical protein
MAAPTPAVAERLRHEIDHRVHEHRATIPAGPSDLLEVTGARLAPIIRQY